MASQQKAPPPIHESLDVYHDPGDGAIVDIVAIPGLGANPVKSWQAEAPNTFNWITDKKGNADDREVGGLANDFPNSRVMLYNYASAYQGRFKIKQFLGNIAMILLDQLQLKRGSDTRRPIVLLGHSMGGLVIAKALIIAEQQRDIYPNIYECISGCVFFGTPFSGAPVADIARMWTAINEKLGIAVDSKLIDLLVPGNEALRELKHDFVRSANKLSQKVEIHCFWERRETHWEALVAKLASQDFPRDALGKLNLQEYREFVSRDSATLPGVGDTGLARTHRELVRFESAKDPEYQLVKAPLRRIVNSALLVAKGRLNSASQSLIDRMTYRKVLDLLAGAELQKKYRDLIGRPNVDAWIIKYEEPEYISWLETETRQNDYLWIHGPEGKGKSETAAAIIQTIETKIGKLEESSDKAPQLLAFFFCDQTPDHYTAEDVVKSLLRQLCLRHEVLATYASHFIASRSDKAKLKANLSIENMWQCLQDMLSEGSVGAIYLVVNNLHHLTDSPSTRKLLSFIQADVEGQYPSTNNRIKTKWLITSRSYKEIRDTFASSTNVRAINLDDPKYGGHQQRELQNYARARAEELREKKGYTRALTYLVGSVLGNRAGNTKWIDMAVVQLAALPADASEIRVQRMLENVSQNYEALLNAAWLSLLERCDDDIENIRELLRALVLTYQDPTESELLVMVGMAADKLDARVKLNTRIDKCRPLVVTRKSGGVVEVGFVNDDAKKHLLSHSKQLLNISDEWFKWQHGILALRCFSHVVQVLGKAPDEPEPKPESVPTESKPDPTKPKPEPSPMDDTNQDIETGTVQDAIGTVVADLQPQPQPDLGAELGSVAVDAEIETPAPDETSAEDERSSTSQEKQQNSLVALPYATKYWLAHASDAMIDIVELLSQEEIFWEPKSKIRRRWLKEYNVITKSLDSFLTALDTWTALHAASSLGFAHLVVALIQKGHKDEIHEYETWTNQPLHLAAHFGNLEIIEELLTAGADVNAMGPNADEPSPLGMAAFAGRVAVMQKLISWNADINVSPANDISILSSAVLSGNLDAVKILMERNAKLRYDPQDIVKSPLSIAGYFSDMSILDTILEMGTNSLLHEDYDSALVRACFGGSVQIVHRLLTFDHEPSAYQKCLIYASFESHWDVVLLILKHQPAQGLDCDDLFGRAATGSETLLEVLQACWDNANGKISKEILDRCLYEATDNEKETTVKLLLKLGADPNATGEEFGNALTAAANDGTEKIILALLEAGAQVNSPSGYALQVAAQQGHVKVVDILLSHGADVGEVNDRHKCRTALQAACDYAHLEVVKLLLDHGANPNLGGGPFTRPIFGAISAGTDILTRLLEADGLELDVVGGVWTLTPLAVVSWVLPAPWLGTLLDHGASIDLANQDGETALIASAYIGDDECVKLLLERGADFMRVSREKGTALEIAAKRGLRGCVDLLLDRANVILRAVQSAVEKGEGIVSELVASEKSGRKDAMAAEAVASVTRAVIQGLEGVQIQ
ncbi:ankyrin repeat-containing domain protein [Podospora appendiculata]|uniref:Ankyrin repeat-containing domain protein n=1 Tax=Podospora appendiculata TaxID=314037 RepID=A0AAE1CBF3_9PEZI|nr:ankyrin repeat-containing domain protein [Podospora appendiculata]